MVVSCRIFWTPWKTLKGIAEEMCVVVIKLIAAVFGSVKHQRKVWRIHEDFTQEFTLKSFERTAAVICGWNSKEIPKKNRDEPN